MKYVTTLFITLLICQFAIAQYGSLQGKIIDSEERNMSPALIKNTTHLFLPFATITTTINGSLIGTQSDFDGFYKIDKLPVGKHLVKFSFVGYETVEKEVVVTADKTTFLDVAMRSESNQICCGCGCHYIEYIIPIYEQDEMTLGYTYGRWDMRLR